MKVIDLLNKYANNEIDGETRIRIDGDIIRINNFVVTYVFGKDILNKEVKLIDKKEIEKLNTWYSMEPVRCGQEVDFKYIDYNTEMFFNKINEIIGKINESK